MLAVVAMLMLLAKPSTGTPTPHLGPGGGLLFGTALALAITAVVDLLVSFRTPVRRSVTQLGAQYQPWDSLWPHAPHGLP